MSIIFDALKKVETKFQNRDIMPAVLEKRPQRFSPKIVILYLVAVGIGLLGANFFYDFFMPVNRDVAQDPVRVKRIRFVKTSAPKESIQQSALYPPKTIPSPIIKAEPPAVVNPIPPSLILNGICFSSNDAYALINNTIVKVGDTFGGMLVKKIDRKSVELTNKESTLKLTTESR